MAIPDWEWHREVGMESLVKSSEHTDGEFFLIICHSNVMIGFSGIQFPTHKDYWRDGSTYYPDPIAMFEFDYLYTCIHLP